MHQYHTETSAPLAVRAAPGDVLPCCSTLLFGSHTNMPNAVLQNWWQTKLPGGAGGVTLHTSGAACASSSHATAVPHQPLAAHLLRSSLCCSPPLLLHRCCRLSLALPRARRPPPLFPRRLRRCRTGRRLLLWGLRHAQRVGLSVEHPLVHIESSIVAAGGGRFGA